MRLLLIFAALLMIAHPASATPIDNAAANAYYANCVAKHDPRMSQRSQAALCSCTAAEMMKQMSVEDIQVMGQNTQAGRSALNHMLTDVYAPCMRYPVEDLVASQCMSDEKISMMGLKSDRGALCGCIAAKTGSWFSTSGRKLMAGVLAKTPNITDPINPVMETPEFNRESYKNLVTCLSEVR